MGIHFETAVRQIKQGNARIRTDADFPVMAEHSVYIVQGHRYSPDKAVIPGIIYGKTSCFCPDIEKTVSGKIKGFDS